VNITMLRSDTPAGGGPDWFAKVIAAAGAPDAIPDMRKVGCAEIRSALNGVGVVLIFVWDQAKPVPAKDRSGFVAWWAGKVPGMSQVPAATAMPAGLTDQVTYRPDSYGRPCS
jgi:hypothetical protein